MVAPRIIVGRYALYHALASGGTATVYLGRLHGSGGFTRTVAVKRLHPGLVKDRTFAAMFLDEARLAARIRHPNVVPIVDVVHSEDELFLVMEYVAGESLHTLLKLARTRPTPVSLDVAAGLVAGVLHGLHAAHEATSDDGQPLHLVHRDVSPHNILVGADGVARVLDFGIAKARGRAQSTSEGQLKGKIAYMAPEQLEGGNVGRRVDIYAAGVVLWEILAGRRLFRADSDVILFARVLGGRVETPTTHRSDLPADVENVVMRALAQKPEERFATAREFALALEQAVPIASAAKISDWVETVATDSLVRRADLVRLIEGDVETQEAISDRAVTVKTPGPPDSGTPMENTLPSVG
ncbi:MAG TPA: serine/threonine-protein kinase, partial [Polyangiaceae bacterium]|nr:serine/threonine-protein kinase [Polyangiaceae bacterium]